jgi:hypothetical protein
MSASRPTIEGKGIPPELVDAFFDRELDEGSRQQLFGALRGDLPRCAEVAKTQRIVSMLREPVVAPDFTHAIMGQLRARGTFVPSRTRRFIKVGRLAAAACLLLGVLGIALLQRSAPDAVRLVAQPKPVGELVNSSAADARLEVQRLNSAMNIVAARVIEPQQGVTRIAPGAERPGQRMISVSLSPGSAIVTLPTSGSGALVVYTGSGAERFIVPDAVSMDPSLAVMLPLGYISPSRAGLNWTSMSAANPFLLPSVAPEGEADQAEARVRIIKP